MQLGKKNLYKGIKNIYIADIHSEGDKLERLIYNLNKKTNLSEYRIILLGDILGKSQQSIKVLNQIKYLKDKYEVLTVCGNWENYIIPELKDMSGCDILLSEHISNLSGFGFLQEFIEIGLKTGDDLFKYFESNSFFDVFRNMLPYFETNNVLATHAPLSQELFYKFYNEYEDNKGILEKFPVNVLQENFTDEENDIININKTLICGHQPGTMIQVDGESRLIPRKVPSAYENRIYLDCGGAGTTLDIPIFAWIEDLDECVSS
jgi:hypothetical protein